MKNFLRFAVIAAGLLAVGGCAQVQNAWSTVTTAATATVPVSAVSVAGNTFDGLEATATNYLRACRTMSSPPATCSNKAVKAKIIASVRAGRVARNDLEDFYKSHPGQLGPQGLYDALQQAISSLQAVISTYKIGAAS